MILNLNYLKKDEALKLNKIAKINYENFDKILNQIINYSNDKRRILLSNIISRNIENTSFYFIFCLLNLVDFYHKTKKIDVIITNNVFLKKIIQQKYPNIKVIIKNNNVILFKRFLNFLSLLKLIYTYLKIKDKKRLNFIKEKKKLIILETFVLYSSFKNNNFIERYSKDIKKHISEKYKSKVVFFVNYLLQNKNKNYSKILKKKLRNFIFLADLLNFKDYVSILFKPSLKVKKKIMYNKYNMTHIINYYLKIDNFNISFFLGQLNVVFFQKLKKEKIDIDKIIDWYENQPIDKGFIIGKNLFFPKSRLKGYVGFINDFETMKNYIPSKLEINKKIVPDELLVSGKYLKKYFEGSKNVKLVPYLRNKFPQSKSIKLKHSSQKKIAVILSADNQEAIDLIEISKYLNKKYKKNLTFHLKTHPMTNSKYLTNLEDIKILKFNHNINALLNQVNIVISGATTATLDAYIRNKFIIVMGKKNGITKNPLNILPKKSNFKVCYENSDYEHVLDKYLSNNLRINNIDSKEIINSFFEKNNKRLFKNFLN